jgi:cytochrome P450
MFYTPRSGGYWIVTRAEVAVDMFRQPDKFSNSPEFNSFRLFKPLLYPQQSDPPEHGEYRKVITPKLTPNAIGKLEEGIRSLAQELIERVYSRGECEFMEDVAELFPVTIFMKLAGAPMEDREKLVDIAARFGRRPTFEERQQAVSEMAAYLRERYRERADAPRDDLLTQLAQSRAMGRELNADEREGLGSLLFFGGLDTLKSALSFSISYLARNPQDYQRLVDDPGLIPSAMEELLRISGVTTLERGATHDFEYRGVPFRKGDRIIILTQILGVDDRQNKDPYTVDFNRETSQHLLFSAGPHRCVGSHLARMEIRVFLEEWVKRIRSFGVKDNMEVPTAGGVVWRPIAVPLVWPV